MLAAARELFSEAGYEGATIRDIANTAGMSTGAVFANFTDKADLFSEIVAADLEVLVGHMTEARRAGVDVDDTLVRIFSAGYAFYQTQLPLARAGFSVSWALEGEALRCGSPAIQRVLGVMADHLRDAAKAGELDGDAQLGLRAEMLFDAYLSNFSNAIFEGWSLEALANRSRAQIRIILAGARAG